MKMNCNLKACDDFLKIKPIKLVNATHVSPNNIMNATNINLIPVPYKNYASVTIK